MQQQEQELRKFLDNIWGRDTCVVRLASRTRDLKFRTTLTRWPSGEEDVIRFILGNEAAGNEVYFSPDLFKLDAITEKRSSKDMVLGSRVICLDFDGNAPDSSVWDDTGTYEGLPEPSYIIQSSKVDNQHVYWIMDEFVTDIELLENMRRAITYKLKADGSGWDAGQLLRPPFTTNHGYIKSREESYDVFIERSSNRVYPATQFTPPKDFVPLVVASIDQGSLPSVTSVLAGGAFVPGFLALFERSQRDVAERDRSRALMATAYYAAESDLSDTEIYALVQDADTRWGKYVGRGDRHIRLSDIVTRARTKYPTGSVKVGLGTGWEGEGPTEVAAPTVYSFKEMSEAPFDINWFITDLLSLTGYGLFVGAPGVGKTQLLIRLGVAVALGQPFLEWKIDPEVGPRRVMMFALEMNGVGVKKFLTDMKDLQDPAMLDKLHENFFIYPQDVEIHIDTPKGKQMFERYLSEYKPSLVFIDSLSKAVSRSLNEEKDVRPVSAYLDSVRRRFGCAIIVIHHGKKRQVGDHSSPDADTDYVYGSRFLTTDADFVIGIEHTGTKDNIRISYSKVRYGPILPPFVVVRDENMKFSTTDLTPDAAERGIDYFQQIAKGNVPKSSPTRKPGPEPTTKDDGEF